MQARESVVFIRISATSLYVGVFRYQRLFRKVMVSCKERMTRKGWAILSLSRSSRKNVYQSLHQAAPSTSNVVNTYHEQQFSGPSEEICEHTRGNATAKSTSHQTSMSVAPTLFSALLPKSLPKVDPTSAYPLPTHIPPNFSFCKKTSVLSQEAYPTLVLPGTVQLLKNTNHTSKEPKNPVRTTAPVTVSYTTTSQSKGTATIPLNAGTQKTQILAKCGYSDRNKTRSEATYGFGKPATVDQTDQIDSRSEYVKKQEALPDTQMQADMRTDLHCIPGEQAIETSPLKISPPSHEGNAKHTGEKVKINIYTYKLPTQSEHVQSDVPTTVHSTFPTKVFSSNQIPTKQAEDPTQSQNSKCFSIPGPVSFKGTEYKTSAAASAVKLAKHKISTAYSPSLPTPTILTFKEKTGHQPLTKDYITVTSTDNTGITVKPPTSPTAATACQREQPKRYISIIQAVRHTSNSTKSTLACSSCSSPASSLTRRLRQKLIRKSKFKAETKTKDMLSSANDKQGKEKACNKVQKETNGAAEKKILNCPGYINDKLTAELSKTVSSVYSEMNLGTFTHLKQVSDPPCNENMVENLVATFNQTVHLSASQSPSFANTSFSFKPSKAPSSTCVSQVSEDCTTKDMVDFTNSTVSSETINIEISSEDGLDTSVDPPNILTAPCSQTETKRKHSKTKKDMNSKEVIKVKIENTPPPPPSPSAGHPSHPEGRWHPFTTDLACRRRARCPHRGSDPLPRNITQWFDVKQNYLCEPPWVTTATLAASVAFRMKQENSEFLL
ncbi:hypothetical protein MHYP_G00126020 [Metynnis hypsauchen]